MIFAGSFLGSPQAHSDWEPPFDDNAVVGSWIGYQSGGLYFYRLELTNNKKGSCIACYVDDSCEGYAVDFWRVSGKDLTIKLIPLKPQFESIQIKVNAFDGREMQVTVKDKAESWERKATLYKEKEFFRKASITEKYQRTIRKGLRNR
jgi:hypothetical protein